MSKKIYVSFLFFLVAMLTGCSVMSGLTDSTSHVNNDEYTYEFVSEDELANDWDYYEVMLPEDCVPGEQYDASEKACYIECDTDTDAECEELIEKVYGDLDDINHDYFGDNGYDYSPKVGKNSEIDEDEDESVYIEYVIKDGNLVDPKIRNEIYHEEIQNTDVHDKVWETLQVVAPLSFFEKNISKIEFFTDKDSGTAAYASLDEDNFPKWIIGVNTDILNDVQVDNEDGLVGTLVHEFAHVLTLREGQISLKESLLRLNLAGSDIFDHEAAKACNAFFTGEGCAHDKSYINQFFERYWKSRFEEHRIIQDIEDEGEYEKAMTAFYEKYKTDFVSDYAASNPGEDIAESYTAFVLRDKPIGNTLADQKIRFFYQFDELIQLRTYARDHIKRLAK